MSMWTHVCGIVRIDCVDVEIDFDKLFGLELKFGEIPKDKFYMPVGSEGSLQKMVWENPNEHHAAKYTVSIWGDLRDYDNPYDVLEWFKDCLRYIEYSQEQDPPLWVSVGDAVIHITNEREDITWTYKEVELDECENNNHCGIGAVRGEIDG